MGGGDRRRTQRNEGDAYKKREKKERLDKENKQVRSMLREERSKTIKQEAIILRKETKRGEGLWSLGVMQYSARRGRESTAAVRHCFI